MQYCRYVSEPASDFDHVVRSALIESGLESAKGKKIREIRQPAFYRESIARRGVPMVGGVYLSMRNGPVTSEILDLINSGQLWKCDTNWEGQN
jgi:hypothetical protein